MPSADITAAPPRDYESAAIEARARAREQSGFWESPLDQAWERINALGGTVVEYDDFGRGCNHAVDQALAIIEELGADSAPKRARALDNERRALPLRQD